MEDKTISQLNNLGTIYQYNTGNDVTLVFNGQPDRSHRSEETLASRLPGSPQEQALAVYLPDGNRRAAVMEQLLQIRSARDLAFKVVAFLDDVSGIDRYVVVKKEFIETLMPFAVNFTQGNSVNNVREQINKMLEQNKWKR
ncbi:MAG: hypothetical protein Q4D36_05395 [Bacteroidales bacterium]|nr:hypothetical protein [Bacteroidales bacterium]